MFVRTIIYLTPAPRPHCPMLALYLSCLVVGGVFVALSTFAGGDSDSGGADKELGGAHDFDHDVGHDFGHDFEFGGHDVDVDHELSAHGADAPQVGEASLADASQGGDRRKGQAPKRKLWLPFLSFRFWTFGAAFFGLTGVALTTLSLSAEPVTLMLSLGLGVGAGTLTSTLVRVLRKPVSPETIGMNDYRGRVGELVMPLRVGGTTKIKIQVTHRERELLAVAQDPIALPRGTRVVVTGFDEQGRAQIVSEHSLFSVDDAPLETLTVAPQEEQA